MFALEISYAHVLSMVKTSVILHSDLERILLSGLKMVTG